MAEIDPTQQQQGTYVLDNESAAEMARLLDQDKMLTEAMGGLFPELVDEELAHIHDVLDIGCGPGGWVNEVARTYPSMQLTGIDISNRMIAYAQAYTKVLKLPNAHFLTMNALEPLEFPDASFDLVNIRSAVAYIPTTSWPAFLAECVRVLRPGGMLRLTDGEIGFSNKPAFEKFMMLGSQALQRIGRGFSPNGHSQGMIHMLKYLLRQAGLQDIITRSYTLNNSYGERGYVAALENCRMLFVLAQPFYISMGVTTQQEINAIAEQALIEMQQDDFCSLMILLTATGVKPAS